ncbi:hypothetical protein L1049_025854 [Liquidambar formosana]|uniref:33 kDa subunit of oxygen evolving system of photosystem II n=1 Tax=Liquidambar formosana TaxID=63359 RepID=A0AAP0NDP4_LIQFO
MSKSIVQNRFSCKCKNTKKVHEVCEERSKEEEEHKIQDVSMAAVIEATKVGLPAWTGVQLKSSQSLCKAFGYETAGVRLTCSLQNDFKDTAQKCVDATKITGLALATSALVVWLWKNPMGSWNSLSLFILNQRDRRRSKCRRGAKTSNLRRNPKQDIHGSERNRNGKPAPNRRRRRRLLRLQARQIQHEEILLRTHFLHRQSRGVSKSAAPEFQKTKLMTRLTYTLDEIEGPFEVSPDGTVKFEEKDGTDYAAITVQLPGGELVPFLFTIKQLVASGKPESFGGEFLVPSYRGSSFLDPKGRGGSTGYDNAVALPAGGRGDEEELTKENIRTRRLRRGRLR